ncbi:hypothetical protein [Aliiroseovarius crassostreae]|uniref:hypothetical protein n=1 Tax=Aliiroseovarius crassostreae TaxID=154981 RepID=UPI003C7ACA01
MEQQKDRIPIAGASRMSSSPSLKNQMSRSNVDPTADSWIWSVPNFEINTTSVRRGTSASPISENETVNEGEAGWAGSFSDEVKWLPLRFFAFLVSLVFIAILIGLLSFT